MSLRRKGAGPPLALVLLAASAAFPGEPPNPLPTASVTRRTLDNGLTVVVRADMHAALVVADLWVAAGAVDDGGSGAAHALEHMVFRGSEGVPPGRVDAAVEAVGGTMYAATLPDATHYWTTVPLARLPVALAAMTDAMRPPTVAPDAWERERRVMLEEIARDAGNLAADARRAMMGRLYGEPHGIPVMSSPARLEALDEETIRAFHRRFYRPDRMTLVVAGPVEARTVLDEAARTLGTLPKAAGKPPARAAGKPIRSWTEVEASDGARVVVGFAWAVPFGEDATRDALAGILRRRLETTLGARARGVEVLHPWQRAGAFLVLVEGAEGDRAEIRRTMAGVIRALPDALRPDDVAAAVRRQQWNAWLEYERPATQAQALGLAAALGEPNAATTAHANRSAVTAASARAAARALADAMPAMPG